MLYSIVRPLAAAAFRTYLRKIYLVHTERIPKDKPVILACNHPTAFMEPCILACFLDRPLYFLVRGDFFAKPVYAKLLRALHMLPVFRLKDGGYRKLKDNFSTFEACHEALYQNQTIMIFAEGNTVYEKRLRPLQKGAARIAFGTLESYPDIEDVYVVPVGVTYEAAHRFRSRVLIGFGPPVCTRDYWPAYEENANDGIAAFTEAVAVGMKQQIVHIDDKGDDELVEHLLTLQRSEHPTHWWPSISTAPEPLWQEQRIANMINRMETSEKETLRRHVVDYFGALRTYQVKDKDIKDNTWTSGNPIFFLILTFLPALIGYLLNFLPLWAARQLAERKVKHIEFFSPVMVASGIGFYLIYFLLLLAISGLLGGGMGLLIVLAVPISGIFSLIYLEYYWQWQSRQRRKKLPDKLHLELLQKRELLGVLLADKADFKKKATGEGE